MSNADDRITEPVANWIKTGSKEHQEFILEYSKPQRHVHLRAGPRTRPIFKGIKYKSSNASAIKPAEIENHIRKITEQQPTHLMSARAIAFVADAQQLSKVAALPGVEAIRFNRRMIKRGT